MATAIWNVAEITCKKCKTNRHLRYSFSGSYGGTVVDHFACDKCGREAHAVAPRTFYPAADKGSPCILVTYGPADAQSERNAPLDILGPGFESREEAIAWRTAQQ